MTSNMAIVVTLHRLPFLLSTSDLHWNLTIATGAGKIMRICDGTNEMGKYLHQILTNLMSPPVALKVNRTNKKYSTNQTTLKSAGRQSVSAALRPLLSMKWHLQKNRKSSIKKRFFKLVT